MVVLVVKARVRQAWLWSRHNPVTLVLVVSALFAWAALADTRHDTEVIEKTVQQSPCTIAPASGACQRSKRESDRERSVKDTCIAFKKVGYRCPIGVAKDRMEEQEERATASTESESSGVGYVTDEPDGTPVTDRPEKPSPPDKPSEPEQPTEPSTPNPPASPVPKPVQVTAPGVTIQAGNNGICAGAAGIRLTLGNC